MAIGGDVSGVVITGDGIVVNVNPLPSAVSPASASPLAATVVPPVWNVPHRRNPNFTGREKLLKNVRKALESGKPAALTQALTGLGGVGKTQTAIEYAYRHRKDYAIVRWIRAEESLTLVPDYAGLAGPLRLNVPANTPPDDVCKAVKPALENRSDWLLIFDNVPHPDAVRAYLPSGGGHVLITSRNPSWRGCAQRLDVHEWPRDDSVKFLHDRSGRKNDPDADALAEALGDLPLAMEQAAAYVEETAVSFGDYVKLFEEHHAELLKHPLSSDQYPATVLTTWDLSVTRAAQAHPAAADLLNLLAYLAPDAVPMDLLRPHAKRLPEPLAAALADDLEYRKVVAALRAYSLIEPDGDGISVHRLVQAVTRDHLTAKQQGQWVAGASRLLNAAFPIGSEDVHTWPVCARLLAHVGTTMAYVQRDHVLEDHAALALSHTAIYLLNNARFDEARVAQQRALEMAESAFPADHAELASILNNSGILFETLAEFPAARTCYERALQIGETTIGTGHPKMAIRLGNLGNVLSALGDLAGARAAYERALRIDESAYGPDHPNVAIHACNLGSVLQALGDLAGARAAYERALRIGEAAYGPDHPDVARAVSNLGLVLHALGDLTEARTAYERALRIGEAAYGADHPDVAIYINNLGRVLQALGDLTGARAAYERALRILEKFLGPDHPNTKTARRNLAALDT